MKRATFLLAAGLVSLAFGPAGAKAADDDQELRLLRAENNLLKATIEQRDKQIEALKKEIQASQPAAPADGKPAAGGWVDLLTTPDIQVQAVRGQWRHVPEGGLTTEGNVRGRLPNVFRLSFPASADDYDIEMGLTLGNNDTVGLWFPFRDGCSAVSFNSDARWSWIGPDASNRVNRLLSPGKTHKVLLRVRPAEITVSVDGEPFMSYRGTQTTPTNKDMPVPNGIVVYNTPATIHTLRMRWQGRGLTEPGEQSPETGVKVSAALPQTATAPSDNTYMYLGRPRPQSWFEKTYREYHDKIVNVNGKYLDIGNLVLRADDIVPEVAAYGKTPANCEVMQVLGESEVLIRRPAFRVIGGASLHSRIQAAASSLPELIFHVKGVDTKGLVDGAEFTAQLVCIGTYRSGDGSTIPSYAVYTPLTKEQFADALAKGFRLVSYRFVKQPKVGGGTETRIIATPAP